MDSANRTNFSGNQGSIYTTAPPPPPPPPVPSQVPALRINTASEGIGPRKQQQQFVGAHQETYEPPAAIQNAMMTKDKKPFTYTPGMGGKLDLSQIRSPRMARRVAKNAEDEGIEGPPKSTTVVTSPVLSPNQPNIYSHPQVAVPVFPANMPQTTTQLRNTVNPNNRPQPVIERQQKTPELPKIRVETKIVPDSPTTPTSPTQVTLSKAPTPWLQKNRPQEDLPEWAKRSNIYRSQDSTPESPIPQPVYIQQQQQQQQPPPPPRQYGNVSNQQRPPSRNNNERVVPLRVEDRPSVFSIMNDTSGHHQFKDSGTPHHLSRWNQPQQHQQTKISSPTSPPSSSSGYVIPIQIEGQNQRINNNNNSINNNNNYYYPKESQPTRNVTRVVPVQQQQQQAEPGPIQSKSFRVLQKITSTDADEMDGEQIRKLQLTEDDKFLMNKFKEQVDGENYLHKEEDPRYRGSAIPSRAFRYLQNMTDSGEVTNVNTTPRSINSAIKKQNRNSKSFDEGHVVNVPINIVPASEQQVPEPKKYMGGAIPSRSFRILQAMTTPESIAPDTTDY